MRVFILPSRLRSRIWLAKPQTFGENMRNVIRAVAAFFALLAVLAILGRWAAYNVKPTHNPSVKIGEFIKASGGRWPQSWKEIEKMGFERPLNKRIDVAWDVDPYELLKNGRISGEVINRGNSCEVVYLPWQRPEGEVDWLLHPWIAEALRESQPTEQSGSPNF